MRGKLQKTYRMLHERPSRTPNSRATDTHNKRKTTRRKADNIRKRYKRISANAISTANNKSPIQNVYGRKPITIKNLLTKKSWSMFRTRRQTATGNRWNPKRRRLSYSADEQNYVRKKAWINEWEGKWHSETETTEENRKTIIFITFKLNSAVYTIRMFIQLYSTHK